MGFTLNVCCSLYLSLTLWVSKRALETESSPDEARLSRGLEAWLPHSPEPSAVKVHHHPLGRIEGEGIGILDAIQKAPELGAQEGSARIGSIDVQPHPLPGTCRGKHNLAGRWDWGWRMEVATSQLQGVSCLAQQAGELQRLVGRAGRPA